MAAPTRTRRAPTRWARAVGRLRDLASRWTGARASEPGRARWVTVVHSDMVASTRLVEIAGPVYPRLLMRHRALIAGAVDRLGGRFLSHAGDGTMAVFDRADDALLAAVEAQRALSAERWPDGLTSRVRMGVHTGEVYEVDGEPVGLAIHHGARIMAVAHPGQVVVSTETAAAAERVGGGRVRGIAVCDAGWHGLRDHPGAVRLHQVVADGVTVVLPDPDSGPLTRPERTTVG